MSEQRGQMQRWYHKAADRAERLESQVPRDVLMGLRRIGCSIAMASSRDALFSYILGQREKTDHSLR